MINYKEQSLTVIQLTVKSAECSDQAFALASPGKHIQVVSAALDDAPTLKSENQPVRGGEPENSARSHAWKC